MIKSAPLFTLTTDQTAFAILVVLIFSILAMYLTSRFDNKEKVGTVSESNEFRTVGRQLGQRIIKKVLAHFYANHKNVDRLYWQVVNEGIMAEFHKDHIPHYVYYGRNGQWKHTLLSHEGEMLPANLAELVPTRFKSYTIFRTEEIVFFDAADKTYILHLRKGSIYIEIVIENNEMIVVNEKEF